jgi:hypothetical protein
MNCANCKTECTGVTPYKFYFGKHGGTDMPNRHTMRTHYQIAGSEEAYFCNDCVDKQIERRARLTAGLVFAGTLLLATLRLVLGGPAPQGSELETVVGFPLAFVAGIVIYIGIRRWKKSRQKEFVGDRMAINLRKADLKRRGFNAFFTRMDYQRLI